MSNLRLGKREGNNYYLLDNTKISKQEWMQAVKRQIEEGRDQSAYEGLLKVCCMYHGGKNAEETALFMYVAEMHKDEAWKQSVGYTEDTFKGLKEVVDELGEKQLTFF